MISIAVVIPTKSRPEALARAIQSVLCQDEPVNELFVVDDNDDPVDVLATQRLVDGFFDSRLRYLRNTRKNGGAGARNTGILASTSTHVAFLDDDDTWEPSKISRQKSMLGIAPEALVFCGYIDDDRLFGRRVVVRPSKQQFNTADLLSGNCPTSTSLAVVPRDLLLRVGMFDETLESLQDFDLWLRCSAYAPMLNVDAPLATFVQHYGARVSMNIAGRQRALKIVGNKLRDAGLIGDKEILHLNKIIMGNLFLGLAKRTSVTDPISAFRLATRALLFQPTNRKCWKWLAASLLVKPLGLAAQGD